MAAPSDRGRAWRAAATARKFARTLLTMRIRYRYSGAWMVRRKQFQYEVMTGIGKPRRTVRIETMFDVERYLRHRAKRLRDNPKRVTNEGSKNPRRSAFYRGDLRLPMQERRAGDARRVAEEMIEAVADRDDDHPTSGPRA